MLIYLGPACDVSVIPVPIVEAEVVLVVWFAVVALEFVVAAPVFVKGNMDVLSGGAIAIPLLHEVRRDTVIIIRTKINQ
jgi:hypothetical protein